MSEPSTTDVSNCGTGALYAQDYRDRTGTYRVNTYTEPNINSNFLLHGR